MLVCIPPTDPCVWSKLVSRGFPFTGATFLIASQGNSVVVGAPCVRVVESLVVAKSEVRSTKSDAPRELVVQV